MNGILVSACDVRVCEWRTEWCRKFKFATHVAHHQCTQGQHILHQANALTAVTQTLDLSSIYQEVLTACWPLRSLLLLQCVNVIASHLDTGCFIEYRLPSAACAATPSFDVRSLGLFCGRPGSLELITGLSLRSTAFCGQFSSWPENFSRSTSVHSAFGALRWCAV